MKSAVVIATVKDRDAVEKVTWGEGSLSVALTAVKGGPITHYLARADVADDWKPPALAIVDLRETEDRFGHFMEVVKREGLAVWQGEP